MTETKFLSLKLKEKLTMKPNIKKIKLLKEIQTICDQIKTIISSKYDDSKIEITTNILATCSKKDLMINIIIDGISFEIREITNQVDNYDYNLIIENDKDQLFVYYYDPNSKTYNYDIGISDLLGVDIEDYLDDICNTFDKINKEYNLWK